MSTRVAGEVTKPIFFETPEALRRWFARHHETERELHAGFHKKDSGRKSITWPESVDEALCVGWIDGVRRSFGPESYTIRFTPRRPVSTWSLVNIARMEVLIAEGRMQPAGLRAFAARLEKRSGIYLYEQAGHKERLAAQPVVFGEAYEAIFKKNPAAWEYFQAQPPSSRKKRCSWVLAAKGEETRLRRLEKLIVECSLGMKL